MTPGVTMTVWRRRPQGGGSGRPFRETRPRGPPPRLSTPCPLVRLLLHPAVGPRARRAPRRAVDVAGGAWGAAARRQEAPSCSPGEGGGVRRGHCWWRAPEPSGSRCSHRVRTCCPRPGGSGWGGRPPAGPRRRRGHVAPAWLQPSREGGRLASGPHRRERLVTPAQSAFAVPPAGSREAPGPSGVSSGRGAWVRRAGRLCRGSVGMALRSQRLVPHAPRPPFSEKRGHTRELDFT